MENVSDNIQSKRKGLYDKICENKEVANLLMALLSNLVILCHRKGKPIEGIAFESPREFNGEITARIWFRSLSIPSVGIWGAKEDFRKYATQYSRQLYKALDKNPRISPFFEQVVEILSKYGERKGLEFKDVAMKKAIITKDDILVIKLGKETLDKWDR
jgi:hypothetical protein